MIQRPVIPENLLNYSLCLETKVNSQNLQIRNFKMEICCNEILDLIMYSITLNFNFKPVCLLAFPKPDSLGKVTKVKSISEETKCVKEIHN